MSFLTCSLITNNTVVKRRRKHLKPYNRKWQQTFNQQQAMEALKKSATQTQTQTQQPHHPLLSTLINSFSIYACDPTPSAYTFIIKTLTKTSQLHHLPPILHRIQNIEKFDPPEQLFSHLIKAYGYANKTHEAVQLFFKIPSFRCTPSAISLNALLSVLCRTEQGLEMVHEVLVKSIGMNIRLEESSFRILIHALCKNKKIGHAVQMLDVMPEFGYEPDSAYYSFILSEMCKIKEISDVGVLAFFQEMRGNGFSVNGADYANVVRVLVKVGRGMDALGLLGQMKKDGIKPDVVVYNSMLNGVVRVGEFEKAEEVFDEMLVLGVVPNVYTYNIYLKGLCMQDKFEEGFKLMDCMEDLGCVPDVCTYNTILRALCKLQKGRRAREEVLRKMKVKAITWNLHTCSILIDGLMCGGEVMEACKLFEDMLSKGFVPMSLTCDELICGLCTNGLRSEALRVIEQMVGRDIAPGCNAWEALLSISELSLEETTSLDLVFG